MRRGEREPVEVGPVTGAAGVLMAGVLVGGLWPVVWTWVGLAVVGLVGAAGLRRRRLAWVALGVAWFAFGAGWVVVREHRVAVDDIVHDLPERATLVELVGVLDEPPRPTAPPNGALARFVYAPPGTLSAVRLERVHTLDGARPGSGRLLVRFGQSDHRPKLGQRVRLRGWLAPIDPPSNPGEFDYAQHMARQGIHGRITVPTRDAWSIVNEPSGWWRLRAWRQGISDAAAASLVRGLDRASLEAEGPTERTTVRRRVALLETLLLGRRSAEVRELRDAFQRVGLAHILSISGAHLAILLGLVWVVARLVTARPRRAALVVLVVLGLFLLAVPWRTPIVRAAVMAGLFAGAAAVGRRGRPVEVLSLAAVLLLVWRPGDLVTAGFQLSFGVVAALLLWADAMSRWLWPPDPVARRAVGAGELAGRWLLAAVSAAVVAWAVSLPLVAYRFALVSPLAALLSVLALVPLTAVLAVGYVKLAVGLVMPGVGGLLGGPLAWLTDTLIGLVAHASRWPGVAWELARPVSGWWTLGALAVVVALLGGRFAGRAWRGALAVAVVTGWLVVGQLWPMQDARVGPGTVAGGSALRVDMFNVGDGSSYLLRSGGQAMLFDCGSRSYPAVGLQSLVPALERLGVGRLDALVISHADLDHMVAALDIADAVRVDRVVVAPDVPRAAGWSVVEAQRAGGAVARPPAERSGEAGSAAAAALLEGLLERGHEVQVVQRGWSMMLGGARVRALWPRAGWVPRRNNDASLVLQVTPGGALTGGPLPGGLLLTGDVGEAAIGPLVAMEGPGGLSASVMELPHHGSWAGGSSLALVDAAGPAWVLQSAGDRALDVDRWAVPLAERGVRRRVTARDGWSTLWVEADGSVRVGP